ncbi:MAG: thiol oxidoreductase [Saprospiraceae bacterium]|nr:thiol oxidoreductase [Saprospiraceae bacterium]
MKIIIPVCLIICVSASCKKDQIITPELPERVFAGGETTIFSTGPDAFTFPLENISQTDLNTHFLADGAFAQHFVSAPATQFGGLGPLFNQNSCESCHIRNGRGIVPAFDGDPNSGLLLRLSIPGVGEHGGIVAVPGFGGQLQNKALFGASQEGKITRTEQTQLIEYLDGTSLSLSLPVYTISDPYIPLPAGVLISPRNAPPVFGLGLLDAIRTEDILALADENDLDGDGISGKPNMVWDVLAQSKEVGRFGWKAEQPNARQQAADAAHNDMGLTSYYFPEEHCAGQDNCQEGLQAGLDVDEDMSTLFAFYFQTLAVPAQRDANNPDVILGSTLFVDAQCSSCHTPRFITGSHPISSLSNQTIYPYTDLLLHDMGPGLADNRAVYSASGQEWRTPPLWGLGLTKVVNPKATFLHDGRAQTLEEAILWHGGEAESSREKFRTMPKSERNALLAFLEGL